MKLRIKFLASVCLLIQCIVALSFADDLTPSSTDDVSYQNDVHPIFQAKCFGCHQGARDLGDYDMTDFRALLKGGETGKAAIVPGQANKSGLMHMISVDGNGEAEMPVDAEPLDKKEIDIIRRWISQGAKNDAVSKLVTYSMQTPPIYSRLPVITSLDYSSDGSLLATSGFHEVRLIDLKTQKTKSRLIGLSPRIESIRFSPDGKRLAIAGGQPGVSGELQVWDIENDELVLSKSVSHDTIYGVSWSPDGTMIAFGSTDTNLRAVDSETGQQILFQGAHDDWIRDTVFSVDGSKLVSVGRDTTCKLTEVKTERFVDNITSITPGALKGGIASVARHPKTDEILIGGADGVPKIYRINRITRRRIGDDANMIRRMPAMPGRIQSVDISDDGKYFVAGSCLNGASVVQVYKYDFDSSLSKELQAILVKVASQRTAAENKVREDYVTKNIQQVASIDVPTGVYSISFRPDGLQIAIGGADGVVRLVETTTGKLTAEFSPVEVNLNHLDAAATGNWRFDAHSKTAPISLPAIDHIDVIPKRISLDSKTSYSQIVVRAITTSGESIDVTPSTQFSSESLIQVDSSGLVQLSDSSANGTTEVSVRFQQLSATIPVSVHIPKTWTPDFVQDVNPILSRLGCNAGTCHGSQSGKNGFKLSLRGYDPIYDIRAFTDDLSARRVNVASPSDSLMLLKATGSVPHQGGKLIDLDDKYYQVIRNWIAAGATLDLNSSRVSSVEIFPKNPILSQADSRQQMRVIATFSDGQKRDVTREAFIEISDTEIASVADSSVTALRRGETPVLARYEGAFTATTLTVMGKRDGYAWKVPESFSPIDELVSSKWRRMKITPSGLCTDEEFVRRVHLDLTGLPPTVTVVKQFIADDRPSRTKREALVDELIGSEDFIEFWSNKWADLLQVNRKFLGVEGATAFRKWIRDHVSNNTPYDKFVSEILTASGSNKDNPPVSYYKILRTPEATMENTTHLFLGTRFNCNKCHDHPFERWTQDQYYETASFFAQFNLQRDEASGKRTIAGSAVEAATPLYERIVDQTSGNIKHDRTGQMTEPAFPFESDHQIPGEATRRQQFAAWLTSADNPYFATSYVNRLWGYLLGTGLIEPLDDIRAGNPATNPELLEYLRSQFVDNKFDMRHVVRLICKSRTYQLSIKTNPFNADDHLNYSHAAIRRLPAEVLFDSIHFVTGSDSKIPGAPAGIRAAMLSDSGAKLPSGFLTTLGRPSRESACECERTNDLQLGSVLALVSGPDVSRAISDPGNALAKLVAAQSDNRKLISELYYRILNREPTDQEIDLSLSAFSSISPDHQTLVNQTQKRHLEFEKLLPTLEEQRLETIELFSKSLDAAILKLDPKLAERKLDREQKIAAAERAFADYQKNSGGRIGDWKLKQTNSIIWHPLLFSAFETVSKRKYNVRDDRSIQLVPHKSNDIYTATTFIDLAGISGFRLELLPDSKLPATGPGLSPNGNLVLNEIVIEVADPKSPKEWQKVAVASAIANIEQPNFPVAKSIDGKLDARSGWAIGNAIGKTSWATFQFKTPVGFENGTLIRFKLHQKFDDLHQIGRFRISLTRYDQPVGLGLSESLVAELSKPTSELSPEISKQLSALHERDDKKFTVLKNAVAAAKTPLKIDPEIVRLQEKLERAKRPVPPDALLTRLQKDLKQSEIQLGVQRLTATQDLAWALINSPSFLFNR